MNIRHSLAIALAALGMAGCGSPDSPVENQAEALEAAAESSTPEAADVLENRADQVREQGVAEANALDNALKDAGNAQAVANWQ